METTTTDLPNGKPVIYFDGGCPVCNKEIAFYRRRPGMEEAITWQDVTLGDDPPAPDLDRKTALARFHMRKANGELVSGAKAFIQLWRMTPGMGWLGLVFSVPPLPFIAELGYRGFLKIRPFVIPRRACEDDACALDRRGA